MPVGIGGVIWTRPPSLESVQSMQWSEPSESSGRLSSIFIIALKVAKTYHHPASSLVYRSNHRFQWRPTSHSLKWQIQRNYPLAGNPICKVSKSKRFRSNQSLILHREGPVCVYRAQREEESDQCGQWLGPWNRLHQIRSSNTLSYP